MANIGIAAGGKGFKVAPWMLAAGTLFLVLAGVGIAKYLDDKERFER